MGAKSRFFAWTCTLLTATTLGLITLGALVRLNAAGLACPDWPLCFGQVTPLGQVLSPDAHQWRVALEVGHRYLAGVISLGVLALCGWAWARPERFRALRAPLTLALVLLIPQAILGGLTVLMRLAPITVSLHLLFGNVFFAALVTSTLSAWRNARGESHRSQTFAVRKQGGRTYRYTLIAAALVALAQIFLGGWTSSSGASLACSGFPACNGSFGWPAFILEQIHYAHRINGFFFAGVLLVLAFFGQKDPSVPPKASRVGWSLVVLVAFQVLLGWYNVAHEIPAATAALHTATGAVLVGLLTYLGCRAIRRKNARAT